MEIATTDIFLSKINSHESFKSIWVGVSGESRDYCNSDEDEGLLDQATILG
jgi:hypothetical protein